MGGRPEGKGERSGQRLPPLAPKLGGISVTLSDAQVRGVLREATGTGGSRELLLEQVDDLRVAIAAALANPDLHEQRVSQAALKALSVFCAFTPRGTEWGIVEVAREQGMTPSTAHRYAQAWVEVGLLQQIPHSRKYRIPPPEEDASASED